MTNNIDWGLAAFGSSGTVSIDIDQTCSGPEMWQATIDINSFHIRFSIKGPRDVIDFFEFLRSDKSKCEKQIGTIGNGTVSVRKDDEFDDRIFISLNFPEQYVCFTVADRLKIENLIEALEHALDDLK